MAEYIDREAAIKCIESQCVDGKMYGNDESEGTLIDAYDAIDALNEIPSDDVAPVRHGYWEKIEDDYFGDVTLKCSLCHEEWNFEYFSDDPDSNYNYNFCPKCGAKMDGGERK